MNRILIAEDEARLAAFLEKGLRGSGFATTVVADGDSALAMARTGAFDLLVLDLGLPGRDGMEVLRALRAEDRRLPVVILSARRDVVDGFGQGADDYVTKPFRFDELLARIRARLRVDGTAESFVLRHGAVALDLRTRRADVDGRPVELTAREYTLLEVLLRHAGQVLSREQLLSHVWGYEFEPEPESNVVDVYVGYLRRKLGREHIVTIRGMGYAISGA